MADLLEKFEAVHGPKKIPLEEFDDLFMKCLESLNKRYLAGTYDYIYQNDSDIYQQQESFDAQLNDLWGKDIQAFREVLQKYYRLTLKCIGIYKKTL